MQVGDQKLMINLEWELTKKIIGYNIIVTQFKLLQINIRDVTLNFFSCTTLKFRGLYYKPTLFKIILVAACTHTIITRK